MNLPGILLPRLIAPALLLFGPFASQSSAQKIKKTEPIEETSFTCEVEKFEHPVSLNQFAMKALVSEKSLADLLREQKLSVEDIPEDWFTASEIHLSSPSESDLVVMGNHVARGPYTSTFWILRKLPGGYKVVFREDAHDLHLQEAKTKGLRNILIAVPTLRYVSTAEYEFDGDTYKIAKTTSELNGFVMPTDTSKFKARKEFIQSRGQDSDPVLADAKAWIWQHWLAGEPAYARVSTQDDDGEEQDCSFFIGHKDGDGESQITLKIHRIAWDQDSPAGPRYLISREDLSIAIKVERIEPLEDDDQTPRVLSNELDLPGSKYQLLFIDHWGSTFKL